MIPLHLIKPQHIPSKHARSHAEIFWLWLIMAITTSVQPELGRVVYTGTNFPHLFWFSSSKEGPDHAMQNWLRSDLVGLVWSWPKASGPVASQCAKNHPGPILAEKNWPATSFPLSDSVAFFRRWSESYWSKLVQIRCDSGCLRQVLAKPIWSGGKPVRKKHRAHF